MITIYSARHRLRDAKTELHEGRLVAPLESPRRAELILERIREVGLGPVESPEAFGLDPVLAVHDNDYLRFLETCWLDWVAAGKTGEAVPVVFPVRRMVQTVPRDIEGRLGFFAFAAETAITETTFEAALIAKDVALSAANRILAGAPAAFALCRPPGHHAARDLFGGYCFLNNAAIAAQWMRDHGAQRVAVLDVDFHHGNGTQDIFEMRPDILFLSIHGDPMDAFPHFSGHAAESGSGQGHGYTRNYPLPPGTGFPLWHEVLLEALGAIEDFRPDTLVVSLGVDTYEHDPISFFRLKGADFISCGKTLAKLRLPTLFVLEGGYAVEAIGVNTVNVLAGFEDGRAV